MGLFGLFGSKGPTEKGIEKQVNRAKERYAQPDYRRMAMDQLLEWDTPESLDGLLQRFTVVVQSPHWDEEEKQWLVKEMVGRGDVAKAALIRFIMKYHEVTYIIKALHQMCDEKELISILLQALEARPPTDHRSVQGKIEIIAALQDYNQEATMSAIVPYLDDLNDDVQCIATDVLSTNKVSSSYPQLTRILSEETRSPRVLRHVATAVSTLQIPLSTEQVLAPEVAEEYLIQEGRLSHRGA